MLFEAFQDLAARLAEFGIGEFFRRLSLSDTFETVELTKTEAIEATRQRTGRDLIRIITRLSKKYNVNVTAINPQAPLLNGLLQPSHARQASVNPARYSHLQLLKGSR